MGKKYIVELGRCERLYKALIDGNGKPELAWLSPEIDLTPYTEPDLEHVRKEAYEKGYEDGKQEIKVGDEVVGVFSDGSKTRPFVFIRGSQEYYFGLYSDTGEFCQGGMNMRKTGRHFPEIASVLEKMRGEQE